MNVHITDHGDGLESMLITGPTGRATLTTYLHGEEVETLEGRATDPDDENSFEADLKPQEKRPCD